MEILETRELELPNLACPAHAGYRIHAANDKKCLSPKMLGWDSCSKRQNVHITIVMALAVRA